MTNVSALDKNDVVAILSFSCGVRNIRLIQSYVRSLGFGIDSIMLRMLYDPRCPIKFSSGPQICNLTVAEVKKAGFVLIVGGNGQALLQAAFSNVKPLLRR